MPYTIHTAKAKIKDSLGTFRSIDVFSNEIEDTQQAAIQAVNDAKTTALNIINTQKQDALNNIDARANARITPDVTNDEVEAMLAPIFDTATAYTAGTYVRNADGSINKLYKLTADHAANTAWADTSKVEVKIGSQVTNLKSAIDTKAFDIGSYNRFNPATVTPGIITKNGTTVANDDWCFSDYIPVTAGETLYASFNLISAANFAMYDSNLIVVPNSTNWSNPFIVPNNVHYIRMTVSRTNTASVYLSSRNSFDELKRLVPYMHDSFAAMNDQFLALSKSAEFSVTGFINKESGAIVSNVQYKSTDFISLNNIIYPLTVHSGTFNGVAKYALYDANKELIRAVSGTSASLTVEDFVITLEDLVGAAYIRLCSCIEYGITPTIRLYDVLNSRLGAEAVNMHNITFTEHNPATNLIDPNALTANKYVSGEDGTLKPATGFYATGFLPIKSGVQYYFNLSYLYRGYCAFYDANKTFISGVGTASATNYLNSPFTAPAGTAYGRFTIAAQGNIPNAWLCEYNRMGTKPPTGADSIVMTTAPENPADYAGNEITVFNKILCIGDSLTDGFFNENNGSRLVMRNRAFPTKLQALTGIECVNMGESGLTTAQWFAAHGSDDLSGYDACIIQLGVNDQLQNVSEADMNTAMTSIINKVKSDNAGIKIFIATIIPANGYMTVAMRTRSEMIRTYVNGLNDANVYLVDLWTYGHTNDLLAYDSGHLSALGYLRLAEDYKAYISHIIRHNPDEFRYVQFIGTSYAYNGDTQVRIIAY